MEEGKEEGEEKTSNDRCDGGSGVRSGSGYRWKCEEEGSDGTCLLLLL